jgi:3-deoxy-D-manno-octulosonate 8-phosphate phosphatase (KDO 8-P phosphatase)
MEAIAPHGLVGAPADAMPEAKRAAHHVTASAGGHGALRDFAEWILRLRRGDP